MLSKALLGEGLLTSHGELHRRQRSLVMPAFHRAKIAEYATEMVAAAEQHAQEWDRRIDSGAVQLDMAGDMSRLTLGIVGRTLFGADLSGDAAEVGHALTEVLENFDRTVRPGPGSLRCDAPAGSATSTVRSMISTPWSPGWSPIIAPPETQEICCPCCWPRPTRPAGCPTPRSATRP